MHKSSSLKRNVRLARWLRYTLRNTCLRKCHPQVFRTSFLDPKKHLYRGCFKGKAPQKDLREETRVSPRYLRWPPWQHGREPMKIKRVSMRERLQQVSQFGIAVIYAKSCDEQPGYPFVAGCPLLTPSICRALIVAQLPKPHLAHLTNGQAPTQSRHRRRSSPPHPTLNISI